MKFGVDVSFHKGYPNWSQAKGSVSFAILGVTELFNGIDVTFNHNYEGCKANGIPVGAYSYSYAHNGRESRAYADLIVRHLGGRPLELPIFLDLEEKFQESYSDSLKTDIIENFREGIEAGGYVFGGIYCNLNWYRNFIPAYAKEKYPFWLASYPIEDNGIMYEKLRPYARDLAGWHYSQNGRVPGFGSESVDMDVWYADIPEAGEYAPVMTDERPMVSYGSVGIPVEQLQILLNKEWANLAVDGVFGYQTRKAVEFYQASHGLTADGIVGPLTWASLLGGKEPSDKPGKTAVELAREVLDGLWDNGEERKKRLTEAGYDYDAVQREVNYLLEDV